MMRAPEQLYGALSEIRKVRNRQIKYPLPSAGQNKDPEAMTFELSGIINSWKTAREANEYSCCKHTIADMFINDVNVVEPSTYPTVEALKNFEEKLEKEIQADEAMITSVSAERSEIRLTDFLYTIGQLMQKTGTEVGSIMLGRRGPINADLI